MSNLGKTAFLLFVICSLLQECVTATSTIERLKARLVHRQNAIKTENNLSSTSSVVNVKQPVDTVISPQQQQQLQTRKMTSLLTTTITPTNKLNNNNPSSSSPSAPTTILLEKSGKIETEITIADILSQDTSAVEITSASLSKSKDNIESKNKNENENKMDEEEMEQAQAEMKLKKGCVPTIPQLCPNGKPLQDLHIPPILNGCAISLENTPVLQPLIRGVLKGKFENCCETHTLCYSKFKSHKDDCDYDLYKCMLQQCHGWFCKTRAYGYYLAIIESCSKFEIAQKKHGCGSDF